MRFLLLVIGVVAYHSASTNSQDFVFPDDNGYVETTKVNAERAVRKGIDRFAYSLFQVVALLNKGNFVFSTLSLSNVLGMLAHGTGGKIKRDLERVLGLPSDSSTTQIGFQRIADKLNDDSQYPDYVTILSANKIYVRNGISLRPNFLDVTKTVFRSEAQSFDSNPSKAAEIANRWVGRQTRDHILNALSADTFSKSTILVLLNTLFFHGKWVFPFTDELTEKRTFYRGGVDEVSVDMMNVYLKNSTYGSLPKLKATFVELPFKVEVGSPVVAMYIILPSERNGMAALERNFGLFEPNQFQGEPHQVNLSLPKFSIESSLDFKEPLQNMGLKELFTEGADFSGMSNNNMRGATDVKIKQKAFLEVFENGAVSAAATFAVEAERSFQSLARKKVHFTADHPFLCVIAWEGSPLVVARYNGPENP